MFYEFLGAFDPRDAKQRRQVEDVILGLWEAVRTAYLTSPSALVRESVTPDPIAALRVDSTKVPRFPDTLPFYPGAEDSTE